MKLDEKRATTTPHTAMWQTRGSCRRKDTPTSHKRVDGQKEPRCLWTWLQRLQLHSSGKHHAHTGAHTRPPTCTVIASAGATDVSTSPLRPSKDTVAVCSGEPASTRGCTCGRVGPCLGMLVCAHAQLHRAWHAWLSPSRVGRNKRPCIMYANSWNTRYG
jgi:hypothetical protein